MKKVFALLFALVLCFCPAWAQDDDDNGGFGSTLMEIGKDAVEGYMGPGVTWFGTSMNSGWYNSSKSLSFFKLPIGISVVSLGFPFVNITEEMQTFDFDGDIPVAPIMDPFVESANLPGINTWDELVTSINQTLTTLGQPTMNFPKAIPFKAEGVPTIFGPDSTKKIQVSELFADFKAQNPLAYALMFDGAGTGVPGYTAPLEPVVNRDVELPFAGIDYTGIAPSFPTSTALTLGIKKIPVVDNIQLGLRWFPTLDFGELGSIGQLGLKLQHEITPHIPMLSSLPLIHTSAYWAMNSLTIEAGPSTLKQSNWVLMLNGSVDFKFLVGAGVFTGLGWESSNLTLDVDMSELDMEDISVEIPGENGFRFQLGVRFSLLVFDLWADANFGSVTSYNLGVTVLGLNGL
jgi:hypothetical protein